MSTKINLKTLKEVVNNYAFDNDLQELDIDLVFDFLVKFDLLNLEPEIEIEVSDEVL